MSVEQQSGGWGNDIIKILQIIAIVAPHIAKTIKVSKTPAGVEVTMQAGTTEVGFEKTVAFLEAWQREGG